MLPRRHRLTRPDDYRAVLRGGRQRRRRAGTDLLVVHVAFPDATVGPVEPLPTEQVVADARLSATPEPTRRPPRVGFVVSRAVGGSVVRHRVVRRLRALVADRLDALPEGSDVVVRAQPAAATASSAVLGQALDHALGRVLDHHGGGR